MIVDDLLSLAIETSGQMWSFDWQNDSLPLCPALAVMDRHWGQVQDLS